MRASVHNVPFEQRVQWLLLEMQKRKLSRANLLATISRA